MLYERPPTFRWNKRCGFSASLDCRPESASKLFLPVICKVPVVVLRKGKTVGSAPASQDGRPDHFFFIVLRTRMQWRSGVHGEEARAVDVDNNVIEESDRERWQG